MECISRGQSTHSAIAFALLVTLAMGLIAPGAGLTGMAGAAVPVAVQAQDPDLCKLLPSGAGWRVIGPNPTQVCFAENTGAASDVTYIEITKYSNPAEARTQLTNLRNSATQQGKRWDPSTKYGDPGFGFDVMPINLDYPGGAFARGCYLARATGKRHPADAEASHKLLADVDNKLKEAPCGKGGDDPSANALRITFMGANTACAAKNTQAGLLKFKRGPSRNAGAAGPYGEVPVWVQTNDGTDITLPFGETIPGKGQLQWWRPRTDGDFPMSLSYGTEVRIPSLPEGAQDEWLLGFVRLDQFRNAIEHHTFGSTGSIKLPCNPQQALEVTSSVLDTLVKTQGGAAERPVVETRRAIATVSALLTSAKVNAQADNTYGVRIVTDERDPNTTKMTIHAGTVKITPKNTALQPVTLRAGQSVQISQGAITPPVTVVEVPGVGSQSFPETGKAAAGIFMDYWRTHGGLAQQGYPISGLIREKSDLNGQTYTVQYFERAVFEFHPEYAPPNDVLLSQLGTFQYKRKYPQGAPNQRPNNSAGSRLFPETGKRVGGKFLEYWTNNGGLAQQGLPISDEFNEVSETDGKTYLVQYFERAVFEHHPENVGKPSETLLSLLGVSFYKLKYQGGTPPPPPGATPTTPSGGGDTCSATLNIAAAANGGSIAGVSSNYGSSFDAANMIDGPGTGKGWSTKNGDPVTNQYFIVALPRGQTYNINRARLNPYSTYRERANGIKNFQIRVSTTDANPGSFRTVFSGVAPAEDKFFDYTFTATQAKYVMLFVVDNYGGSNIEATEFEVYEARPCTTTGQPTPTSAPQPPPPPGQPTPTTPSGGGQCANIPASQNMSITPTNCARAGSTFAFEGFGFNANERVGVYATGPDGQVIGAPFQVTADAQGRTSGVNGVRLETAADSPQGIWALTMEGVTSRKKAIGYIRVLP